MAEHTRGEILSVMGSVPVAAIATSAGEHLKIRMMHYATDDDFNVYLATMKGDPKTVQITNYPSITLLIHQSGANINESREVEIIGKAVFVTDRQERERALQMTAGRSPVVKYLTESGAGDRLDCIKVVPDTVKYRIFSEIVQGMPPTFIEFPANRQAVNDWQLLRMKLKSWFVAIRFPSLTASVVPVLLGGGVAWFSTGTFHLGWLLLTLLAGVLMHIGANVLNDYFDHKSGNDESNREFIRPFSGGSRVIQQGLLTPVEVLAGGLLAVIFSAIIGFFLAWARGPVILLLGAVGVASALFYTGGPLNWARRGIGELVVGLNFGVLMTLGAYFVQTGSLSWLPVISALPVSLLIAAVLYINEFPDYDADRQAGKNTLVVRLGRKRAVALYVFMMAGVYLSIAAGVYSGALPAIALISWLTLPLTVQAVRYATAHHSNPRDLVPANALTATAHLATGLLLTLAFVWKIMASQGLVYPVALAVAFVALVIWMYRYIERQKNIFLGLRQALK